MILYLSQKLETLVDFLLEDFESYPLSPFQTRTIMVPSLAMKQWLFLEIAKRKTIATGYKFVTPDELFHQSQLQMVCRVYSLLENTDDPLLKEYLNKGNKEELALVLGRLFTEYNKYGKKYLKRDWQYNLWKKIGSEELPDALPSLYCFAIEALPPKIWEYVLDVQQLKIFLFSPCEEFWSDLCTNWERKKMNRFWQRKGAPFKQRLELDAYLRNAPPLLANWGKIGRETLKVLEAYDFQVNEMYPVLQKGTLLHQIQRSLLHFEELPSIIDDSIQLIQAGSSRLREVELVREEILRLGIPYSDIAIMASDIDTYVPLIEAVFKDIPTRITGAKTLSSLKNLLTILNGRWDVEDVLTLFQEDRTKFETICRWVKEGQIKWGVDAEHRKQVLEEILQKEVSSDGSWMDGIDRLVDQYINHSEIGPIDLFEEWVQRIFQFKEYRKELQKEKTLKEWGEFFESLKTDEDLAPFIRELKDSDITDRFPFSLIQPLLLDAIPRQVRSSHLHAVRISPIETPLPAKAIFLLGMDEESFPRKRDKSSLNLLESPIEQADKDRYFLLQTLFAATDYLRISYLNLSPIDGKPVEPSFLIAELPHMLVPHKTFHTHPQKSLPNFFTITPPKQVEKVSIAELSLLAKHPWKFHLQKVLGIYIEDEWEETFALQKSQLVRGQSPVLPKGVFGEALQLEATEKIEKWQEQIKEWGTLFSIQFRESCDEKVWEDGTLVLAALEINGVKIVGELKNVTEKGLVCTNDDTIGGLLKAWPEALIAASVTQAQVLMLKNGKVKQIDRVLESLQLFIEYYLECLRTPSALINEWADTLLRKEIDQIDKTSDDRIVNWVLSRFEVPIENFRSEKLKNTFASLIALYPTRKKALHATI